MNDLNKELDVFLQAIKQDFCWILYSYEYVDTRMGSVHESTQRASFPFCCKLSAQLVSSFLYAKYSNETECIYATGRGIEHGWTVCDDTIIDYTDFQFQSSFNEHCDRFKNYDVSEEELKRIVSGYDIYYTSEEHSHDIFRGSNMFNIRPVEMLAVDKAKEYAFTKEGFLAFVNDVFTEVQLQMNYYGE